MQRHNITKDAVRNKFSIFVLPVLQQCNRCDDQYRFLCICIGRHPLAKLRGKSEGLQSLPEPHIICKKNALVTALPRFKHPRDTRILVVEEFDLCIQCIRCQRS